MNKRLVALYSPKHYIFRKNNILGSRKFEGKCLSISTEMWSYPSVNYTESGDIEARSDSFNRKYTENINFVKSQRAVILILIIWREAKSQQCHKGN